jgi:putative peptidoglycan lipid II flippase
MSNQASSQKPNVAKAGVIMMASIFLSRVLGIGRDTIMVSMFGRGDLTDAYALAFQIPDFIFYLLASGALSSAFIPVFSEYYHNQKVQDAWKVFSTVVTYTALIVGTLIVLAYVYAGPLLHLAAGGKTGVWAELTIRMSRIILPAQFAFLIGGLMFGTLYARQKFTVPGLGPNIYNLGIIFGAVGISHFVSPGIVGMAWGALIGAILGNLIIPAIMMVRLGVDFKPSLDYRHPGVQKVFKFMLPVIFGLSLPAFYAMLMRALGSYYPSGIVTSLEIGNKLMQAPLGIFGQGLALAVFPTLSQFYAQNKMDMYGEQLNRTVRTILYISIPASVILYVLSQDVVTALLQYGKFKHQDTLNVTACFKMFSFGISAWCLQAVLMRAYYAAQNTWKPVLLGTVTTGIFVLLAYLLKGTALDYLGLPLASSLAAIILVLLMVMNLAKDTKVVDTMGMGVTCVKALVASLIVGLILHLLSMLIPTELGLKDNIVSIAKLIVLGLGGSWLYYALTKWLKMPEIVYAQRVFQRINKKRGV